MNNTTPADRIEQLEQMRAGTAYSFPITCREFLLQVRPLTCDEHISVTSRAQLMLLKEPAELRTSDRLANIMARQILQLSSSTEGQPDYHMTDYLLGRCTPDELQHLYMQWLDGCRKCSPAIESINDEELLEMAELVKKNPEELTGLSRSRLSALVRYLLSPE